MSQRGAQASAPGLVQIGVTRRRPSPRGVLMIIVLTLIGIVILVSDLVYFPQFPVNVNATIFSAEAEAAVAVGIGLEVWLHYLERLEKPLSPPLLPPAPPAQVVPAPKEVAKPK